MSSNPTTSPTVEEALAELREMFPDEACLQIMEHAWYWKEEGSVQQRVKIIVGLNFEEFKARTLSEAMARVRSWYKE